MFCDKTGTLTKNELIFKAFKILGPMADQEVAKESRAKTPETFGTQETSNKDTLLPSIVGLNTKLHNQASADDDSALIAKNLNLPSETTSKSPLFKVSDGKTSIEDQCKNYMA